MRRAPLALVVLLAAASAAAQERPVFEAAPPVELPDLSSWESEGASVDLKEPARTLEYELWVQPGRGGIWAVTRYRILTSGSGTAAGEREWLQWIVGGQLRRFACLPRGEAGGSPSCRWRELSEGSPEYQTESANVLLIWRMHRRLLWARAHSLLPHPD